MKLRICVQDQDVSTPMNKRLLSSAKDREEEIKSDLPLFL